MRLLSLLLAVLALALLAGCGGGERVTQTREVAPFDRIAISDSVDVDIVPGDSRTVVVSAGERIIGRVQTETRDGVLHVDIEDRGIVIGPDPFDDLRVEVAANTLQGIRVSGAGDVRLGRIDADRLTLEISGSGDIEGHGRVGRLDARIEGSGDAQLFDLVARTARVSVVGAGEAELNVTEELDLRVEGSGDVIYRGRPLLRQVVEGAGDVRPAG